MSESHSEHNFYGEPSGFDSLDCVDLVIDGPGDTTVRPARPQLLKRALAERERIEQWLAQQRAAQPPEGTDPKPDGSPAS